MFPALNRWAIIARPSGAGFSFHDDLKSLFFGGEIPEEVRQRLRVLGGLAEAGGFVGLREARDFLLQAHFLNGSYEIQRGLGGRLTPAEARHSVHHAVVPEGGGFARGALGMREQAAGTNAGD